MFICRDFTLNGSANLIKNTGSTKGGTIAACKWNGVEQKEENIQLRATNDLQIFLLSPQTACDPLNQVIGLV